MKMQQKQRKKQKYDAVQHTLNARQVKRISSCRLIWMDSGEADIDTGIGFFDHMLKQFCQSMVLFDLTLRVKGDLDRRLPSYN